MEVFPRGRIGEHDRILLVRWASLTAYPEKRGEYPAGELRAETAQSHRDLHRPLAAAAVHRQECHQRIRYRGARIDEHAIGVANVRSSSDALHDQAAAVV